MEKNTKMKNTLAGIIAFVIILGVFVLGVGTIIYLEYQSGMSLDEFYERQFDTSDYQLQKYPTQEERETMVVPGTTRGVNSGKEVS